MTTEKPKAPRKPRITREQIALAVLPAIYASAGPEILSHPKSARMAERAVKLAFEVADAFRAHGSAS